jgi:single-stranded-DNA-specific exonuclease
VEHSPHSTVWTRRIGSEGDGRGVSSDAVEALAAHLRCPRAIAEILAARGIATPAAAEAFLHPSLGNFLFDPAHDPRLLLGMECAVDRVLRALRNAEPILIYGDYDVDGTTAIVLLKTTLERVALALDPARPGDVRYHVPHRIREGYGMQSSVLARAAAEGVRLVISVDTGIRALAEAAEARALGLDLIVTDHHLPDMEGTDEAGAHADGQASYRPPDCLAVINPNQPGCPYPNKNLCGAAVAFKLAHALLDAAAAYTADPAAFRERTATALIPSFLKLVAIATVADAVPLTGENRVIAALGLAALAQPVQPGLRALMELAKLPLDRAPTASEVAFRLAPRINAAGRMDVASGVVELFLTRDAAKARALAEKLDALNAARRDSEAQALAQIERQLASLRGPADSMQPAPFPADVLVLDHAEWHRGVLGILASRVVERTHRPALVLSHADGEAHGSGRSIPGFHLLDAITAADRGDGVAPCEASQIFHRFGGHAHAVGFSLPLERLPVLRARLTAYAAQCLTPEMLTPVLRYDAELEMAELQPGLVGWLERLAPFGHGNAEPVFLLRAARLSAAPRTIKERHICLEFAIPDAAAGRPGAPTATISALGWSRGAGEDDAPDASAWSIRCAALGLGAGDSLDLLVRLRRKTGAWANPHLDGLELELCDLRRAVPAASRAEAEMTAASSV